MSNRFVDTHDRRFVIRTTLHIYIYQICVEGLEVPHPQDKSHLQDKYDLCKCIICDPYRTMTVTQQTWEVRLLGYDWLYPTAMGLQLFAQLHTNNYLKMMRLWQPITNCLSFSSPVKLIYQPFFQGMIILNWCSLWGSQICLQPWWGRLAMKSLNSSLQYVACHLPPQMKPFILTYIACKYIWHIRSCTMWFKRVESTIHIVCSYYSVLNLCPLYWVYINTVWV